MIRRNLRRLSWQAGLLLALASPALPCDVPVAPSNVTTVRRADVIVRARAVANASAPTPGPVAAASAVRFRVLEVIKGTTIPSEIVLPGYLTDRDDFNDQEPPYRSVRPGGQSGCYASNYREGADFLLLLKRSGSAFTVDWYAPAPLNEQLRSADDPWLVWVRETAK